MYASYSSFQTPDLLLERHAPHKRPFRLEERSPSQNLNGLPVPSFQRSDQRMPIRGRRSIRLDISQLGAAIQ